MPANLPPIGLEISCSSFVPKVPLRFDVLGLVTLDFKGGWRSRVEAPLNAGLGGVMLRVIQYEFSAESRELGKVTIRLSDRDMTPLSLLEIIRDAPPLYRHTMFLDYTITLENPPFAKGPLELENVRTAKLTARELVAFPPQGSIYQLQEPIDLAPVRASQVLGQILQFPATTTYDD